MKLSKEIQQKLKCPKCNVSFPKEFFELAATKCLECENEIFWIDDKVPVLMVDPKKELTSQYANYLHQIDVDKERIKILKKAERLSTYNKVSLNQQRKGVQGNNQIFERLKSAVEPWVDIEYLARKEAGSTKPYWSALSYVKRDWSWKEESEEENSRIYQAIVAQMENYDGPRDSVAVLGCGAGRLAAHLAKSLSRYMLLMLL